MIANVSWIVWPFSVFNNENTQFQQMAWNLFATDCSDELDGLVTYYKYKWFAIDVEVKVFTHFHTIATFMLCLWVSFFTINKSSAGIGCKLIA